LSGSLVKQHEFPNGLGLVAETIPSVRTVGFTFLLPAGAAFEPTGAGGTATMLAEWVMRGAGDWGALELLQTLDNLGVSHSESAQTLHTSFSGLAMGRKARQEQAPDPHRIEERTADGAPGVDRLPLVPSPRTPFSG
jgi:hypothetical protein